MSQAETLEALLLCRYVEGMNRRDVRKFNILAPFLLFLVGCSDTSPSVSILRAIDGFDFVPPQVVTASLNSVPLQANCSLFVGNVEMSFDGGTTWITPTSYDPTAKSACENGSFAITLSRHKSPWNSMTFSPGQTLSVKFRAQPRVGDWIYRNVAIKFAPSTPLSQETLAGGSVQSGGGYVLRGRARMQDQHVASGGGYSIRGRITQ